MRISDWSSDVCSSDLLLRRARQQLDVGVEDLADVDVAGTVRGGEGETVPFVEQGLAQVVEHVLGADPGRAVGARVTGQTDLLAVLEEGVKQFIGTAVPAVLARVAFQPLAPRLVTLGSGQD